MHVAPVVVRQAAIFGQVAVVLRAAVGGVVVELDIFQILRERVEALGAETVRTGASPA